MSEKASFRLNAQNNLVFGSEMLFVSGQEGLAQDIRNRLRLFLGEYPFDTTEGVAYLDRMRENNAAGLKKDIIAEIKKDERVAEVLIKSFEIKDGRLNFAIEVTTSAGEVINVG